MMATYATRCGWLVWLAILSWHYYVYDDDSTLPGFLDMSSQDAILRAFIVLWCIGLVWNLAAPNGTALHLLALAPCRLEHATRVTFDSNDDDDEATVISNTQPQQTKSNKNDDEDSYLQTGKEQFMAWLHHVLDWMRKKPPVVCEVYTLGESSRFCTYHLQRYAFSPAQGCFVPAVWTWNSTAAATATTTTSTTPADLDTTSTIRLRDFLKSASGLSTAQVYQRWQAVGSNQIDLAEPHFSQALNMELSQPFYTYQWFMVASWCPLYYYYMAFVWFVVISTSAVASAWFHYRNQRNLFRLAHVGESVQVWRNGVPTVLPPTVLVPGDVIRLTQDAVVPCDLVLVQGGTCLLDESALTGESYPQVKTPIDPTDSNMDTALDATRLQSEYARHVLFAGTSLLQHEEDHLAVVWRTGSATSKGELLRNVVSYKRDTFSFDVEVGIVMIILLLYAILCFNVVVALIKDKAVYGFFYGIYVVGTILPPLLPTVFTVSVGVSDDRLARKRIATAQSESILVAGKVTHAFFDKTGTLTEPGLRFMEARSLSTTGPKVPEGLLQQAMATCHSLTPSLDGRLIGNPVDLAMFEASQAKLVQSSAATGTVVELPSGQQVAIVRHFEFDHHRMTQSVILQVGGGDGENAVSRFIVLTKGSGESIRRLCLPESMPPDFEEELVRSARAGIYQISVAFKDLPSNVERAEIANMSRDDIETSLVFMGVLDFQNVLRNESPDMIRQLTSGGIASIMVTGDSVQTGIRIALEAGILQTGREILVGNLAADESGLVWTTDEGLATAFAPTLEKKFGESFELVLSGKAWAFLLEHDLPLAKELVPHVRVFGRCTPHDKVTVIRAMVDLGHITLMCGDGGNDVGALKAVSDPVSSLTFMSSNLMHPILSSCPRLIQEWP